MLSRNLDENRWVFLGYFESSLIKVTDSVVSAVEVSDVGNIEVTHKFRQIRRWRFDQQVKVVGHKDIAMKFDGVDVNRLIEQLKKTVSIRVVPKKILFFIASTGDVVYGVGVLDVKGSGHNREYRTAGEQMSKIKK